MRRPRGGPRRRVAAQPPARRGRPGRRRRRQGRRLHQAARPERGRGRARCSALVEDAGVFNAYLENVVFNPRPDADARDGRGRRDRPADDVPGPRGPQRPARAALLGRGAGRRRRAAGHGAPTAPSAPATCSARTSPVARRVRVGRHARPRRPDHRRGQRGDAHALRGRPGRRRSTCRGRPRAASRAASRSTATPAAIVQDISVDLAQGVHRAARRATSSRRPTPTRAGSSRSRTRCASTATTR